MMNPKYWDIDFDKPITKWRRGDRYYHNCDAFDSMDDMCEEVGNMHWDLCTKCIKLPDLYDRLDFEHHEEYRNTKGSIIDGPCARPEYYWSYDSYTGDAEPSGEYACNVCEIVLNYQVVG